MLEIRWHSRAGQGAVTGAKGLADVISTTGKHVQAFAFYGSAKRGAAMTAYNRVDDKMIMNHEKYMRPDYVFVIDPALVHTTDVTINDKENTVYIITTHLSTEELVAAQPRLVGKKVFTVDCIKIAQETIGRPIPNTPMLGAFMKVSKMYEMDFFKESMQRILAKLPQKIVDANMIAIQRAFDEVK
ncbi:pyruvate flavodoxin oxidoreductase subunit gamma [bacterium]|nr:pyruvate flavodoxin oxidoreductase subunit gamma [bacterium]MBU1993217.1 pyruvate flavodoxin oxidoreductase subunit gamma [bacterium]